jgi:hypothetical protein
MLLDAGDAALGLGLSAPESPSTGEVDLQAWPMPVPVSATLTERRIESLLTRPPAAHLVGSERGFGERPASH